MSTLSTPSTMTVAEQRRLAWMASFGAAQLHVVRNPTPHPTWLGLRQVSMRLARVFG